MLPYPNSEAGLWRPVIAPHLISSHVTYFSFCDIVQHFPTLLRTSIGSAMSNTVFRTQTLTLA